MILATNLQTSIRAWLVAVAAALTLILVTSAAAGTTAPPITLGPVSVTGGAATLTGTLGADPDGHVGLSVNGQPVGVDATGQFTATVDLGGQSAIQLVLSNPETGEATTISIPLTLAGPDGTIPSSALDLVSDAATTVVVPPGGFEAADGSPITVSGSVLNPSNLSGLTINGANVLSDVGPDGQFTTTVPGNSREVVIVMTGTNGVSQTTSFPVTQVSSLLQTSAGTSVAASSAQGLRIASVRYLKTNMTATKRLRVVVTVKDRRGYLVRGAVVRVGAIPTSRLLGTYATTTNNLGRATLDLRVDTAAFGNRLTTRTTAKTPKAATTRITHTMLPPLKLR